MIYRIITEDKGHEYNEKVYSLVSEFYTGFSVSKQIGYYKGKKEASIVIEIDVINGFADSRIDSIALRLKELLEQECILIQRLESQSSFTY